MFGVNLFIDNTVYTVYKSHVLTLYSDEKKKRHTSSFQT